MEGCGGPGLQLSFVKPFRFHLNVLILLGTVVLLGQKPIYLLLYGVGVGTFLVYKNFVPVVQFVNDRPENRNVNTAIEEAHCEEHFCKEAEENSML